MNSSGPHRGAYGRTGAFPWLARCAASKAAPFPRNTESGAGERLKSTQTTPARTHTPRGTHTHPAPLPRPRARDSRRQRPPPKFGARENSMGSKAISRGRELRGCLHGGAVSRLRIKLVIMRDGKTRQTRFLRTAPRTIMSRRPKKIELRNSCHPLSRGDGFGWLGSARGRSRGGGVERQGVPSQPKASLVAMEKLPGIS